MRHILSIFESVLLCGAMHVKELLLCFVVYDATVGWKGGEHQAAFEKISTCSRRI